MQAESPQSDAVIWEDPAAVLARAKVELTRLRDAAKAAAGNHAGSLHVRDTMAARSEILDDVLKILRPRQVARETRIGNLAEFEAWLRSAAAGARCVYHRGLTYGGQPCAAVSAAAAAGEVTPHLRRNADGNFDFIAVRTRRALSARRAQ